MLRRVGLGLPRVPLEHKFSIYEMRGLLDACGSRVPVHTESYAAIRSVFVSELCQIPPETPANTVIYGDTPMHIVVAEVVDRKCVGGI